MPKDQTTNPTDTTALAASLGFVPEIKNALGTKWVPSLIGATAIVALGTGVAIGTIYGDKIFKKSNLAASPIAE